MKQPPVNGIEDVNVVSAEPLTTPAELKAELPVSRSARQHVLAGRAAVKAVLAGSDPRWLVVVGPCSIHDPDAAREYARRLRALADETDDVLLLVMRAYFEKPRTTVGWKGLINDPALDDSFQIERGLRTARRLLLDIAETGLPLATEALDPITPQYLQDLISWSAIGARTAESQTHREMASGLSSAVGFKNGTDGNLEVAVNALQSVAHPHRFLGIDHSGRVAVMETRGNRDAHIVLRGGRDGPNFDAASVAEAKAALAGAGVTSRIMIDCSHQNSAKDPSRQPLVLDAVLAQVEAGDDAIVGVMLESNLNAGRQPFPARPGELRFGVSITDACIGWDTTEEALRDAAGRLRARMASRRHALSAAQGRHGQR